MKPILIIVFVLTLAIAKEELYDDIDALLSDTKLANEFYKVVKRLGIDLPVKPSESVTGEHPDPNCRNKVYANTIIRTSDSRKAGANFLRSVKDVKSNVACYGECCNTDGCDLAVYGQGEKTKHNCYLFNCKDDISGENRCVFNNYTGYVSTTVSKMVVSRPLDKTDLDLLKEEKVAETTTDVPSTTTTPKPTPPPTERPHTVTLGGICHSKLSCEDPNAECLDGTCQCKVTFYKKQRVCRQICIPTKEFECRARGTSWRGPDCIASSLVCDGTHDCANGSDELNCPTKATPAMQVHWLSKSSNHDSAQDNTDKQDKKDDAPDSSSDSSEATKDENHYGFPPFVEHANWDYDDEDNADRTDNDFKLDSLENETGAATDSISKSSSSSEHKESENEKPVVAAKNTMPVISWADEESDSDRNTPSKLTKQEELSFNQKDLDNLSYKQKDNNGDISDTQMSSKYTEIEQPHQHLAIPSQPQSGRPEAMPRPTPAVDSIPDIIDTVDTGPEASPDDTEMAKDDSKPLPYDTDNWSDFIKNSDLSPPQKPVDSTPDDLPYVPDQLDYHQNAPYPPNRPYQPLPPHYGPNQLGRYPNYRYPPYNQPYSGYSLDYPDYDPYFPGQNQDLRNTGLSPPADPNYPGRGYRLKPEQPGRRPTQDDKEFLVNHKGTTVDKSDTSQQLPDNIIDTESPGSDLIDQPDKSEDSSKTNEIEDNSKSQVKTDSHLKDKEQEADNNNIKGHTSSENKSIKPDKTATTHSTASDSDSGTVTKPKENKHIPDKVEIVEEKETFITREKVVVASPTDNAQGPIVALSLGLAITLILLVFVGCRLRTVRKRLRKGRPLHSNEADYLINGMYL